MDGFDCDINWKWCLRVAVGLAQGSSYLHIKGVIHRDIKSLNIYVLHCLPTHVSLILFLIHRNPSFGPKELKNSLIST